MKNIFYLFAILCILFCSSCSITRQTACPTFTNKTNKIHKPLFSKKQSSKKGKKQLTKVTDQAKKVKTKKNNLTGIENITSKIELHDIMASSDNDITLNSADISPSFIESKIQKIIYKKIEKKSKKVLKNLEKQRQEKHLKKNHEQIISKKKHKKKRNKKFNSKNDDPKDEREVHDLAILSMLVGILIFITPLFKFLIGGWFLVPAILFTILAIHWGVIGEKQIIAYPSKYKGEVIANIGVGLGIIGICVLIVLILAMLPPLFSFSFDGLR